MNDDVKILKIVTQQVGWKYNTHVTEIIGEYTDTTELNKALQKYNISVDDLYDLGENLLDIPDNSYGFILRSTHNAFVVLYVENKTLNKTLDKSSDGLDEDEMIDSDKLLNKGEKENIIMNDDVKILKIVKWNNGWS